MTGEANETPHDPAKPDRNDPSLRPRPLHKRETAIAYRRFTEKNLRRIANRIADEYLKSKPTPYTRLAISFAYTDDTYYELQDAHLADTDDAFAKSISRFSVNCRMTGDREISIKLQQSGWVTPTSTLTVSGPDNTWVNGLTGDIIGLVNESETQPRHRKREGIYSVALAMFYALLLVWALSKYTSVLPDGKVAAIWLFIAIAGFLWLPATAILTTNLSRLWPVVELQTGPPHTRTAAVLRSKWFLFLSVFGFPVFLTVAPVMFVASDATTSEAKMTEEKAPFELTVNAERATLHAGDTAQIAIYLRNTGTKMIPEVSLSVDAPGFDVDTDNEFRKIRFLPAHENQVRRLNIPISRDTPRGTYAIDVRAAVWISPSDLQRVTTRLELHVE